MDLAVQAGTHQIAAKIPEEYKEFSLVFDDKASQRIPPSREWDHTIELKPGAPDALDCKIYPMTREEDVALEKFINEMVANGYI
jgi:hypothetical protein